MKITTPLISDIFNCPQASLELKLHVGKERKQDPTVIDVLQGVSRYQRCGAATDDDVLTERRTIVEARAKIGANAVPNRTLEQQQLQRFSAIEAKVIEVGEGAEFGSDVKIGARIGEKNSGIDEIGLALFFVRTKRGEEAAWRRERDAGAGEADLFAIPEAEEAAGEGRQIEDGIETAGAAVTHV